MRSSLWLTWHTLESFGKREAQLRNWLHQRVLWAYLWEHFLDYLLRAQFTVGSATTTHDVLDCIRKQIKPWGQAREHCSSMVSASVPSSGSCLSSCLEVLPWLPFVMHCYNLEAKISLPSLSYFWSAFVMAAEKLLEQVMYTFGLLWISLQWILTK